MEDVFLNPYMNETMKYLTNEAKNETEREGTIGDRRGRGIFVKVEPSCI